MENTTKTVTGRTPDTVTPPRIKLPPFWQTWLTLFLLCLPVLFWTDAIYPSLSTQGNGPSLASRIITTPLLFAALPYFIRAVSSKKEAEAQVRRQEQQRLDALRTAPTVSPRQFGHYVLGGVAAFVGTVSCTAHLVTGHPTVVEVVLFTVGIPLYFFLIFQAVTALSRWKERRTAHIKELTASAIFIRTTGPISPRHAEPTMTARTEGEPVPICLSAER